MRVFLSWSGEASKSAATALRDWLPLVVQAVEPYVSAEDIDKGARWSSEIGGELESCNFGIICLTPENIDAPWIHFEAGALSKSLDVARVSPFLLGMKPADITGPLVQFQFTLPEREDVLRLVTSINAACDDSALDRERLQRVFDALWSQLDAQLRDVVDLIERGSTSSPRRLVPDMLEELLNLSRTQTRLLSRLELSAMRTSERTGSRPSRNLIERSTRRALAREMLGMPGDAEFAEAGGIFNIRWPQGVDFESEAIEALQARPEFEGVRIRVRIPEPPSVDVVDNTADDSPSESAPA